MLHLGYREYAIGLVSRFNLTLLSALSRSERKPFLLQHFLIPCKVITYDRHLENNFPQMPIHAMYSGFECAGSVSKLCALGISIQCKWLNIFNLFPLPRSEWLSLWKMLPQSVVSFKKKNVITDQMIFLRNSLEWRKKTRLTFIYRKRCVPPFDIGMSFMFDPFGYVRVPRIVTMCEQYNFWFPHFGGCCLCRCCCWRSLFSFHIFGLCSWCLAWRLSCRNHCA